MENFSVFDRYFPVPRNLHLSNALTSVISNLSDLLAPTETWSIRAIPCKLTAPFKHINIKKGDNGTLLVSTPGLFSLEMLQSSG